MPKVSMPFFERIREKLSGKKIPKVTPAKPLADASERLGITHITVTEKGFSHVPVLSEVHKDIDILENFKAKYDSSLQPLRKKLAELDKEVTARTNSIIESRKTLLGRLFKGSKVKENSALIIERDALRKQIANHDVELKDIETQLKIRHKILEQLPKEK